MTEVEYVLEQFDRRFRPFRDAAIVLHGTRGYAEAILDRFGGTYRFAGVMTLDSVEGPAWRGLPVIREEALAGAGASLLILTERVKYAETAFRAVRRACRESGIRIFDMYGVDQFAAHMEADTAGVPDPAELREKCFSHDAVAFEVMDTLFSAPDAQRKLVPRRLFVSLIPQLRAAGKTLRFSLRKSFPEEKQLEALRGSGLLAGEEELVRRAGEDLSFRTMAEALAGKRILYVGSGLVNEFLLPRCYGIDTVLFVGHNAMNLDPPLPGASEPDRTAFDPALRERIREAIGKHGIISFDVFDTLLMRKTLFPRDVFALTERRALEAGLPAAGFAAARARVEDRLRFGKLEEIYRELGELFCWDGETERAVMAVELAAEKAVLVPRDAVVSLFRYALEAGKRVVLTSEMYLPGTVLREILEEKGIRGYERLLVSCEAGCGKKNGLYGILASLAPSPGEILHVGDNPEQDGNAPAEWGIESILVPSPLALARSGKLRKAVNTAKTLPERCLAGSVIARLCGDPFRDPAAMRASLRERTVRLGAAAAGPLMTGYLCRGIQKLRAGHYDGVLFLSRDGWLPRKVYEGVRVRLGLPRGMYTYASRRSAFLCCMDSEARATRAEAFGRANGLDTRAVLTRVFRIPERALLPRAEGEMNDEYLLRHLPLIRKIAEQARRGYAAYARSLGLRPGGRYLLVDFVSSGTIQRYLSEALPISLEGFYFGTYAPSKLEGEDAECYLKKSDSALLRGYVELEKIFSSPEPSLDYLTETGEIVFQRETRSEEELEILRAAWDEASSLAEEFFRLFYSAGDEISPALAEALYEGGAFPETELTMYDDWLQTEIRRMPAGAPGDRYGL